MSESKPVTIIDRLGISTDYVSGSKASAATGIPQNEISKMCRGHKKSYNGCTASFKVFRSVPVVTAPAAPPEASNETGE
jgi:hypothetical protein